MPALAGPADALMVLGDKRESMPSDGATRVVEQHGRGSLWLRAEHLAIFVAALWLYAQYGGGWLLFTVLFLVPDLSLMAHILSPRAGAAAYNVAHSFVVGVGLLVISLDTPGASVLPLALAWVAHISFDRLIGLAYPMGVHAGARAGNRQAHQGGLA
jgi:Domain of unknown function (DUF4260)